MKKHPLVLPAVLLWLAGVAHTSAQPAASKPKDSPNVQAQLRKLPGPVRATVEAEARNATIKSISTEKAHGKTVYELESLVNGRTRDLMIDSTGKVYVVEEQLDLDKAPAPVRAALEAQGTVGTLESVMENGRTHYEGQVRTRSGKKVELTLEADGTPVKK